MDIYKAQAEGLLAARKSLVEQAREISGSRSMTDAQKRSAIQPLNARIQDLTDEVRSIIEQGEREAEVRNLGAGLGSLVTPGAEPRDLSEWRGMLPSLEEYRAQSAGDLSEGGYTVPSGVASQYVDTLRNRAVFLKGLPTENLVRFSTAKFTLPVLSDSDMPALVAENAAIPGGDDTWAGLEFDAKAYKDTRTASNELLADSAVNMRDAVAQTLTRNVAAQFDKDAFQGTSANPVLGILGQGTPTTVGSASGDLPKWDDLADAVGRIWAADGDPTVIWAAPDAATALGKERVGTNGVFVADPSSPLGLARSLPVLHSTSIPAGTVVVADGTRCYAGIREDVRIAVSEHAAFTEDGVVFRLTMRAAGIYVVETSSVQVLKKHA
jgi:HK97 family phage major capsid protein